MITSFFLQVGYAILSSFVLLLPVIAFPTQITTGITTVFGYLNALSFLLPVSTILTVLGLAMIFHITLLVWRLAHLIGGYLRGR